MPVSQNIGSQMSRITQSEGKNINVFCIKRQQPQYHGKFETVKNQVQLFELKRPVVHSVVSALAVTALQGKPLPAEINQIFYQVVDVNKNAADKTDYRRRQ